MYQSCPAMIIFEMVHVRSSLAFHARQSPACRCICNYCSQPPRPPSDGSLQLLLFAPTMCPSKCICYVFDFVFAIILCLHLSSSSVCISHRLMVRCSFWFLLPLCVCCLISPKIKIRSHANGCTRSCYQLIGLAWGKRLFARLGNYWSRVRWKCVQDLNAKMFSLEHNLACLFAEVLLAIMKLGVAC